jgi:hypothetical protein
VYIFPKLGNFAFPDATAKIQMIGKMLAIFLTQKIFHGAGFQQCLAPHLITVTKKIAGADRGIYKHNRIIPANK